MQLEVQILGVLTSLAILIVILRLIYLRRLKEEYSLLWLLAAGSILGFSVFGRALTKVADFLQIGYVPSLLFAMGGLFGLLVMLSQAVAISSLADKNCDLAQEVAILKWHLERLQAGKGEETVRECPDQQ